MVGFGDLDPICKVILVCRIFLEPMDDFSQNLHSYTSRTSLIAV